MRQISSKKVSIATVISGIIASRVKTIIKSKEDHNLMVKNFNSPGRNADSKIRCT